MSHIDSPLVAPVSDAQHRQEDAVLNHLREDEVAAARDIVTQTPTADGLQAVIEDASGFAEAMTQKLRDPATPAVACKRGCYWCCYQSIPVSAPETFRISRFLSSESMRDRRAAVIERLRKLDARTRGRDLKERAKLRVPCAFLENGSCTVYEVRPLACAEMTSFDVQDCKRGQRFGFEPGGVIHEKARMLVYGAIYQGLVEGLRQALPTADTSPLELTAAVVSALDNPAAESSWLDGGEVFAAAHFASDLS
jgi:Fe-S-cluster containining protein